MQGLNTCQAEWWGVVWTGQGWCVSKAWMRGTDLLFEEAGDRTQHHERKEVQQKHRGREKCNPVPGLLGDSYWEDGCRLLN